MPWAGGSFSRTDGTRTGTTVWAQAKAALVKIIAADHDTHDQDLATGINQTINKDGSNAFTGDADLGNNQLTNVGAGSAATDGATIGGTETLTGKTLTSPAITAPTVTHIKLVKGADVASAAALTLLTDGNYFDITGTTTVTSIATLGVGIVVKLHFDGALILTHHATDLILPGAANITTAAGDEAEFVEYATGDWRCVNYSPVFATDAEAIARTATNKAVTPANLAAAQTCRIKTGTYTGDGTTSQAITGVGFAVKRVEIIPRITTAGANMPVYMTTDVIVDDNAAGQALQHAAVGGHTSLISGIIALGADGFTVDDGGTDANPNTNAQVYNYTAWG